MGLMYAVQASNAKVVDLLLAAGAPVKDAVQGLPAVNALTAAVERFCADSGDRQRNVFKALVAADFDFFETNIENLMEKAAEEAQSDLYEFIESCMERPAK